MTGEQYFRELIAGERSSAVDRAVLLLFRLVAFPYALVMQLRAWLYRTGILQSRTLPRPVVAVGNLTMGGTGKTPTVLHIARLLQERGKRVAVLTRGYGGSREGETLVVSDGTAQLLSAAESGDEPYLLATALPGLMVVMGPDRYRAGLLALETLSPDIFILDDGFQHLRLRRDLNVLLLDGIKPFSNGRVFPAGYLREPVAAARRADLIIFTRCAGDAPHLPGSLTAVSTIISRHALVGWKPLAGGEVKPFSELSGRRTLAFAGIADPAPFFDALEAEGVSVVATVAFPDHTTYGRDELEALARLKREKKAEILITTGKDAVKLHQFAKVIGNCSVAALELELDDPRPLLTRINNLL